jgi:hypothetical protein
MPKSTSVRVRELRKVFGSLSASNFEAIVARLAPLHEDLRIELHDIAEDTITQLDQMDVRYITLDGYNTSSPSLIGMFMVPVPIA